MTTEPLAPISLEAWSAHAARHLLNRAGFGVPQARVDALARMTPEAAVDSLLEFPWSDLDAPPFVLPPETLADRRRAYRGLSEEARREAFQERQRQDRMAMMLLKAWWLERMARTPDPLEEKLTLMWHGHFATSAQKVRSSRINWDLHQTLRRHAAGNLRDLTTAVGQSTAMLIYLDNARSTRERPNENWARELLELFTLGQGHYSEEDIKEAARAFTGWTSDGVDFQFRPGQHDRGPKRFLGERGRLDGHDIIRVIFEQPACARHFATRLWTYFGAETPNQAVIDALAEVLRAHDYEVRPALRALFLAQAFYDDTVMGAQIKGPAQLAVQLVHDLRLDPVPGHTMADASARLGQDLFYPPNVKGWDGNSAWANANAMLMRVNLPAALVAAPAREQRMARQAMAMLGPMMAAAACPEGAQSTPGDGMTMTPMMMVDQGGDPGRDQRPAPFDLLAVLEGIPMDAPLPEAVDRLAARFLAVPLSPDQARLLVRALGGGGRGASPDALASVRPQHLRAALQLLLSTAEYQLC